MPIVDLEKERQIVEQGKAQGKSEDFIKQSILRFREQNQTTTPQYTDPTANMSGGEKFLRGIGMGVAKTAFGASSLGEKILKTAGRAVLPKSLEDKLGINNPTASEQIQQKIEEKANYKPGTLFTPQSLPEGLGLMSEQIAEFLVPGSTSTKVGEAAGALVQGERAAKALNLGARMATEGVIGGGITAIQKGKINDKDVATSALISAAFPAIEEIGKYLIKGAIKTGEKVSERIETSIIKPGKKDIEDGFKIANVTKYGVGGNLDDMMQKTTEKINNLSHELNETLASSNASVNIDDVLKETKDSLLSGKTNQFGNNVQIESVLNKLSNEVDTTIGKNANLASDTVMNLQPKRLVSLPEATYIKRGAGRKGAWVFNSPDPEATAVEKVYTTFYRKLKDAIEKESPNSVSAINKQLSDLIPIQNAIIRRMPVEERRAILSLTDNIGLFSAFLDHRALGGIAIKKLLSSGTFANYLFKAAQIAKNIQPKNIRPLEGLVVESNNNQ